jgi:hypothetical protein
MQGTPLPHTAPRRHPGVPRLRPRALALFPCLARSGHEHDVCPRAVPPGPSPAPPWMAALSFGALRPQRALGRSMRYPWQADHEPSSGAAHGLFGTHHPHGGVIFPPAPLAPNVEANWRVYASGSAALLGDGVSLILTHKRRRLFVSCILAPVHQLV